MKLFLAITSTLIAGVCLGYFTCQIQSSDRIFRVQRLDPIQIEEAKVEGDPFSTGKRRAYVCLNSHVELPKELSNFDQFFGGFSTDPPLAAIEEFYAISVGRAVIGVIGVVVGEDATVSVAEFNFVSGHYILSDQRYFKNKKLSAWLKQL